MAIDTEYVVKLLTLVKSNAPSVGRPLGRLRISLQGTVKALAAEFDELPGEARLANLPGEAGRLRITPDGRVFLSPQQMRAVGGYKRAGRHVRVKFLLPLRRHLYDAFFAEPGAADDLAAGDEVPVGSGVGITVRVSTIERGDPTAKLARANKRLRHHFAGYIAEFPEKWDWDMDATIAQARALPNGPRGKRWMVQVVRAQKNRAAYSKAMGGRITVDTPPATRFRTDYNELHTTVKGGAVGKTFTETIL